MVAVRASHCLGKLVPLLPPESPLRAGSRATATVGREAAAWRAVADTSGAGAHPGVWELAWPTIVSNLLFSASGFIDIKIVGSLGASAVAAITTGTASSSPPRPCRWRSSAAPRRWSPAPGEQDIVT